MCIEAKLMTNLCKQPNRLKTKRIKYLVNVVILYIFISAKSSNNSQQKIKRKYPDLKL